MMKRVALITGVAGGIGSAAAELFSGSGWSVIGVDLKSPELKVIDKYISADVSEEGEVIGIVKQVMQKFDRLDALINNAAIQVCKPVIEMNMSEWDNIMAVNVRSAFLLSKATYPLLRKTRGSIVNVSSVHAIATSAHIAAYAASKGALLSFTRALAIEFASAGIRVNAVLPGAVDTTMLRAGLERGHLSGENIDELIHQLADKTVNGRVADPREIAQAILFLADNEKSSFMTGQALVVDGGASARLSTE